MSIFKEWGVRDGKDRAAEGFLYNLAACYVQLEKRIGALLSGYGLSPVQMNALLMICHVNHGKGISQVDIGKRMIVTAGNITRLLDRLERERLVQRVLDPGDRRVKKVKITPKGEALLDKAWPVYKRTINRIVSELPDKKVTEMTCALESFRHQIGKNREVA